MGKFQRPRASRARFDRRDHDMRIVVKVGTSTLAHPTGRLNIQRMEKLCKVLSDLKNMGHEILLVSSGAIAMGFGRADEAGLRRCRPVRVDVHLRQALHRV